MSTLSNTSTADKELPEVTLDAAQTAEVEEKAGQFVADIQDFPVDSEEFNTRLEMVRQMGAKAIRKAADYYGQFMRSSLSGEGQQELNVAAERLSCLQTKFKELDPGCQGDLTRPKKLLGFISLGDPLKSYFSEYQNQQVEINTRIQDLLKLQDLLLQRNSRIDLQKGEIKQLLEKLKKYLSLSARIDELLVQIINKNEMDDNRKQITEEQVLFCLRQRQQDMLSSSAVNMQAWQALSLIQQNNRLMISGIETVTSTTVKALQTAVTAAAGLTQQQLNLAKISSLAKDAGQVVNSSARRIQQEKHHQAAQVKDTDAGLTNLKLAFQQVNKAIDDVTGVRNSALKSIRERFSELPEEADVH